MRWDRKLKYFDTRIREHNNICVTVHLFASYNSYTYRNEIRWVVELYTVSVNSIISAQYNVPTDLRAYQL